MMKEVTLRKKIRIKEVWSTHSLATNSNMHGPVVQAKTTTGLCACVSFRKRKWNRLGRKKGTCAAAQGETEKLKKVITDTVLGGASGGGRGRGRLCGGTCVCVC